MTQDPTVYLPAGFLAAGINAGIKNAKRDLGLLVSDGPSVFAACLTTNKTRAHPVNRAARVLEAGRAVRAVVVNSGNANALTGPEGAARDERMARAVAERLGVLADEVLTASTGSIGVAFPIETVEAGVPKLVGALSDEAEPFARAIMTTDRVQKIASREVFVAGTRVRLVAMTKGAGMIQPSMATMLCFVATDVEIAPSALQAALRDATDRSAPGSSAGRHVPGDVCPTAQSDCAAGKTEEEPVVDLAGRASRAPDPGWRHRDADPRCPGR